MSDKGRTPLVVAAATLVLFASACSTGGGRRVDVNALLRNDATTSTSSSAASASATSALAGDTATGNTTAPTAAAGTASTVKGKSATSVAGRATSAPVRIGFHLSKDLGAAYTALGAKNAPPDSTPYVRNLVNWINDHGGIAGRKIDPVFHLSNPLDGSFDAEGQATCTDFADDNHVFAVISGAVLPTIVTADCLSKKHVPLIWDYHYVVDGQQWKQYLPYLYMPFSVNADRMGFYVDVLASGGYFDAGARVAIVRYDLDQHARFVANVLRPRLAAHHVNVVDEVALNHPDSAAQAADVGAQIGSAILRMRAERVDHVLFVPTGGAVPFLFMSASQAQGFKPRYAMNSLDIPYFVTDQAPAGQLHGALAVGWSPPSDVYPAQLPPPNDATKLCYQAAQNTSIARFCDALFFLKAAVERAGRFDAAALRTAVESMGTSFQPVYSIADTFGPGRHDGASAARLVRFDDGCGCFNYTGPTIDIG
ncbi:MAG TPA: ABC transporter substrate-binding protein [Acidimicrobiales bacterium]|nr:ABC transporter substrate-binding protein [Acidimicrobiales bacterium]